MKKYKNLIKSVYGERFRIPFEKVFKKW